MPRVTSTAVDRVDYTPARRTLDVWFTSGLQYRYLDVPQSVYEELLVAPSIGAFVNNRIKPEFEFVEVTERRRFRPPND